MQFGYQNLPFFNSGLEQSKFRWFLKAIMQLKLAISFEGSIIVSHFHIYAYYIRKSTLMKLNKAHFWTLL